MLIRFPPRCFVILFKVTTLLLAANLGCSSSNATDTAADAGYQGGASPEAAVIVPVVPRPVPDDVFTRKAIGYSGYRTGQRPGSLNRVTEDQVKEDLQLLMRGGWTFIRLFDSSDHAATVLKVIKDNAFDIKVVLGVWISGPKQFVDPLNRDQIEKCIALDAQYGDIIAAVSVGNETLDDWSSIHAASRSRWIHRRSSKPRELRSKRFACRTESRPAQRLASPDALH